MTTHQDIERHKRIVEACLEDYATALAAYSEWMDGWHRRQQEKRISEALREQEMTCESENQ